MAETYTTGVWTAKEGQEEAFVQAWTAFAEWASEAQGAQTMRLTRDLSEPRRYLSFAPWNDADAIHTWKGSAEFRERMAGVRAHTDAFTPSELELVTAVRAGSSTPA